MLKSTVKCVQTLLADVVRLQAHHGEAPRATGQSSCDGHSAAVLSIVVPQQKTFQPAAGANTLGHQLDSDRAEVVDRKRQTSQTAVLVATVGVLEAQQHLPQEPGPGLAHEIRAEVQLLDTAREAGGEVADALVANGVAGEDEAAQPPIGAPQAHRQFAHPLTAEAVALQIQTREGGAVFDHRGQKLRSGGADAGVRETEAAGSQPALGKCCSKVEGAARANLVPGQVQMRQRG
mmetsp:Transcript_17241/g.60200  ORF Transcript_17241/g.60200 Transcript_17241/m.60200 type:complete len:234 (-) Transcript_17241:415-1116(-)